MTATRVTATREHGSLSTHQAGPNAIRHGEDVIALLEAELKKAQHELTTAEGRRHAADTAAAKWAEQVDHYQRMLAAVRTAAPKGDQR